MVREKDPDQPGLVKRAGRSVAPLFAQESSAAQRKGAALRLGAGAGAMAATGVVAGEIASAIHPGIVGIVAGDTGHVAIDTGFVFIGAMFLADDRRTRSARESDRHFMNGVSFLATLAAGSTAVAAIAGDATHALQPGTVHGLGHAALVATSVAAGTRLASRSHGRGRAKPTPRPSLGE